jgi:glycosyltransferase involved in cell wall biosynthesis
VNRGDPHTNMRRVAFVPYLSVLDRGGQVNVVRLLKGLDPTRFRCMVFCPKDSPLGKVADAQGATVVPVNVPPWILRSPIDWMLAPFRLLRLWPVRRALADFGADVVYVDAAFHVAAIKRAVRASAVPVVWHVQTHLPTRYLASAMRDADVMISVSASTRSMLMKRSFQTIVDVPNAVDVDRFSPGPRDALREERGVEVGARVLLYVGGVERMKGITALIEMLAVVLRRGWRVKLWVLGRGDPRPFVRHARKLQVAESIDWLGARTDVARFYRAADVFVFASLSEGMPLAVLEAMACGIPCVASAIPGVCELLEDGAGWLATPGDHEALGSGVVEALEAPVEARARAEKARLRVHARHTEKDFVRRFSAIFEDPARSSSEGPLGDAQG